MSRVSFNIFSECDEDEKLLPLEKQEGLKLRLDHIDILLLSRRKRKKKTHSQCLGSIWSSHHRWTKYADWLYTRKHEFGLWQWISTQGHFWVNRSITDRFLNKEKPSWMETFSQMLPSWPCFRVKRKDVANHTEKETREFLKVQYFFSIAKSATVAAFWLLKVERATYRQKKSCSKELVKHLQGGESTFGDVHRQTLTATASLKIEILKVKCNVMYRM